MSLEYVNHRFCYQRQIWLIFFVTGKDAITEIGTLWQDQNHAFFIDSLLFFNHNLDFTALPFPVESADHA